MHVRECGLAALAAFEVGERLVAFRPFELAVEMRGEERQEAAALLGEALGVDLGEAELGAQALARAKDELGDRVLLHADELADLRVRAVLELAEREHQTLARLQMRVRDPHLVLLAAQEQAALGIVLDVGGNRRLRHLGHGLLPLALFDLLQKQVLERRKQVGGDVGRVRVEAVEARHGAEERLLHEIVRVVRVP